MPTVTVSSKYQIVVPREARRRLGITSGTRLQAIEQPTGLRLVKEPTLEEIPGLLKGLSVQDDAIRREKDRSIR
jgi:AbrB family looped-hinge helix DNA binding protein